MTRRRHHGLRGLFGIELAILGVIAGLIGLAGVQTWRLHLAQLTVADLSTELQAQRRQAAENLATAHAEALLLAAKHRAIEQAWIRKHQEVAREAEDQARRAAAAADGARIAGDGLRHRASQLAASAPATCPAPSDTPSATGGPPAHHPAAVLADVLGRLEEAGRQLAAVADARGRTGAACERAYEALLAGSVLPKSATEGVLPR